MLRAILVRTLVGGWCKGRSNFCSDLQTIYENIFYFSEMSKTRKKNYPLRTWQIHKRNRDMYIISYILMNRNIHCIGKSNVQHRNFSRFCLICGLLTLHILASGDILDLSFNSKSLTPPLKVELFLTSCI